MELCDERAVVAGVHWNPKRPDSLARDGSKKCRIPHLAGMTVRISCRGIAVIALQSNDVRDVQVKSSSAEVVSGDS